MQQNRNAKNETDRQSTSLQRIESITLPNTTVQQLFRSLEIDISRYRIAVVQLQKEQATAAINRARWFKQATIDCGDCDVRTS